jgi:negative elongation factor B
MIGNNVKLYDMVLQFLRTLFVRTKNVHYCSLRAELLMTLHDAEVHVGLVVLLMYSSNDH